MDRVDITGTAVPNRLGTAVPDAGNRISKRRESPSRPSAGFSSVQFNMSGLWFDVPGRQLFRLLPNLADGLRTYF